MTAPPRPRTGAVRYFLLRAPFAIAASSLQGTINYAIVLYLAFAEGLEATGTYRTIFSFFSLLGLASMLESNKVFVRSIVDGDTRAATYVAISRLCYMLSALFIVATAYVISLQIPEVSFSIAFVAAAGLAGVYFSCDFYQQYLVAKDRFARLMYAETLKYIVSFAVFLTLAQAGYSIVIAVLAQLGFMALCNVVYFGIAAKWMIDRRAFRAGLRAILTSAPAKQSRTYSIANLLPASLEHVDKLLVGLIFGLESLGIYTLAFSTGRFIYNSLKPALTVYHRRFVDQMPDRHILQKVWLSFTALGAICAAVFLLAINSIPALSRFAPGAATTIILFLSYGVGMVYTLYAQAISLNRNSDARRVSHALVLANSVSFLLLGTALALPFSAALIILALQYPVREALSFWLLVRPPREQAAATE